MASPGNQHCAICIGTLSFAMRRAFRAGQWTASCLYTAHKQSTCCVSIYHSNIAAAVHAVEITDRGKVYRHPTPRGTQDFRWGETVYNKQHVLDPTLPGNTKYHPRPRPHNFKLTTKNKSISECDFIIRMLFKDVYWHYARYIDTVCIYIPVFFLHHLYLPLFITCLVSCNHVGCCLSTVIKVIFDLIWFEVPAFWPCSYLNVHIILYVNMKQVCFVPPSSDHSMTPPALRSGACGRYRPRACKRLCCLVTVAWNRASIIYSETRKQKKKNATASLRRSQ